MRIRPTFAAVIAVTVVSLGVMPPVSAQEAPVDISGLWYGGGGPRGRVASPPVLTERGHRVSDGFDVGYDPHNLCIQAGLIRHLTTPYPMKIEQYPDKVLLIYEEWEIVRTVFLDTEPPPNPGLSAMGYSFGHYEDDALVMSTIGLMSSIGRLRDFFWFQSHETTIEERYSLNEQGQLVHEVVATDPVMLEEPWRMQRTYSEYEHELLGFGCELRDRPTPEAPPRENIRIN